MLHANKSFDWYSSVRRMPGKGGLTKAYERGRLIGSSVRAMTIAILVRQPGRVESAVRRPAAQRSDALNVAQCIGFSPTGFAPNDAPCDCLGSPSVLSVTPERFEDSQMGRLRYMAASGERAVLVARRVFSPVKLFATSCRNQMLVAIPL
jgi:hypothetical protein